jgi:hypothetical protein
MARYREQQIVFLLLARPPERSFWCDSTLTPTTPPRVQINVLEEAPLVKRVFDGVEGDCAGFSG